MHNKVLSYENEKARIILAIFVKQIIEQNSFLYRISLVTYFVGFSNINLVEVIICLSVLDNDMAIPIAWDRKRFAKRLVKNTKGHNSSFFYNHNNYKAHLFLPINIAIIYYGNHSLLAGILKKEGKIKSNYVFNMGNKYDEIKFDGTYYREIQTNEILYKVKNFELGAIFEIGRILEQYNIQL